MASEPAQESILVGALRTTRVLREHHFLFSAPPAGLARWKWDWPLLRAASCISRFPFRRPARPGGERGNATFNRLRAGSGQSFALLGQAQQGRLPS